MQLRERINAFVKLGDFLRQFSNEVTQKDDNVEHNELFFDGFKHQLKLAKEHNGWFTEENIKFALKSWSDALIFKNLNTWLEPYTIINISPKEVAIIMADITFYNFFYHHS